MPEETPGSSRRKCIVAKENGESFIGLLLLWLLQQVAAVVVVVGRDLDTRVHVREEERGGVVLVVVGGGCWLLVVGFFGGLLGVGVVVANT